MKVLDLFSGIGGFSLGLKRAGMTTVAFCEIEPYCRAVLKKHWPDVPCHDDVRTLDGRRYRGVDVICGGFPCQDISLAGRGAGIGGERSGLWSEFARIIGEARPRYAIVENVSALRSRGLDVVLGRLAALGYDAEWHCIPASAVGAPHLRDRIWVVANAQHPDADGERSYRAPQHVNRGAELRHEQERQPGSVREALADAARVQQGRQEQRAERQRAGQCGEQVSLANPSGQRLEIPLGLAGHIGAQLQAIARGGVGDARRSAPARHGQRERPAGESSGWLAEPDVGRVAHGVPSRVDRLRALGNAVVPQIPEIIGRAIMEIEHGKTP